MALVEMHKQLIGWTSPHDWLLRLANELAIFVIFRAQMRPSGCVLFMWIATCHCMAPRHSTPFTPT